jgi:small subunit ribosomal protein S13
MGKTGKGKGKSKKSTPTKSSGSSNVKMKGLPQVKKAGEGLRGIVRIAGRDLPGSMTIRRGLLYIKGFGHVMSRAVAKLIEKKLGIPQTKLVGELTDEDVEKIDNLIFNLSSEDLPSYLFNRRKDMAEGKDMHVIMNDLIFATRNDIEDKKKCRSWQGYRHMKCQKVRGQRTKNTGRRGITVGVIRKKK